MQTVPFTIERVFDAPVNVLWKAITDKDEMKQWYFDLEEFKAEPGFKFSFTGVNCSLIPALEFSLIKFWVNPALTVKSKIRTSNCFFMTCV